VDSVAPAAAAGKKKREERAKRRQKRLLSKKSNLFLNLTSLFSLPVSSDSVKPE
jgi:hypothetical protein